jgi:hypothetical protein
MHRDVPQNYGDDGHYAHRDGVPRSTLTAMYRKTQLLFLQLFL